MAHTKYFNKDGVRLCSVTTFLGVLNKPALIHWAWNLGMDNIDYRERRDTAGDVGTLVHYLIMCELTGETPYLDDFSPNEIKATEPPMDKWHDWGYSHTLEPILVEEPMVSEEHQFGGTPDCYGLVDGVPTLLDFKTGKDIYSEAFYQTAAYKVMLEEYGYQVDEVMILRLGKDEEEGFDCILVRNLDLHFKLFKHCQGIYLLQSQLRKKAKGTLRE